MTHGLSARRGIARSTASASPFRWIGFFPVLLSGRNSIALSKSTCSHRRVRISDRRAPVKSSSRIAAIVYGELRVSSSASWIALPRRAISSVVRNRSRAASRYLSTRRQGLEFFGTSSRSSAKENIADRTATTRLAWYGASWRSLCSFATSTFLMSLATRLPMG